MAGADRLSSLPDEVLCHILSFLPTTLAIATSVLSKRWRPLWRSLSSVDFHDQGYMNDENQHLRFVRFVYAVMLSLKVQSIKRFRLRCESFCDSSTINIWVNSAIQFHLEQLELSMPNRINLPRSILGCRTLVTLKLKGITVNAISSVHLSSLKILHLDSVKFPDYDCVAQLLYGCPILEDLLASFSVISSSFPMDQYQSLPKLVKADMLCLHIPWELIRNVKFLHIHTFGLSDSSPFPIPTFTNLAQMELDVVGFWDYDWKLIGNLLLNSPNLQILDINKNCYTIFGEEKWRKPQVVPKCLSSRLTTCRFEGYDGLESEVQFARYIMQNAKVLRNMTICTPSSLHSEAKLQILKRLCSCRRNSTCELFFE